jgi:hypothetical protein
LLIRCGDLTTPGFLMQRWDWGLLPLSGNVGGIAELHIAKDMPGLRLIGVSIWLGMVLAYCNGYASGSERAAFVQVYGLHSANIMPTTCQEM